MPGCFLTNLCRSTNWSKWDKNRHQKGPKHKRHSWVIKLVFLPKQVSQKHIFDISYTLGVIHRPKMCKIGPKRRSKVRNSIVWSQWNFKVSKIHSWVVKLVCYLTLSTTRSDFVFQTLLYFDPCKSLEPLWLKVYFLLTLLGSKPVLLHNYESWKLWIPVWLHDMRFYFLDLSLLFAGHCMAPIV